MISFGEFLRETAGYEPYPWQERFAVQCLDRRPANVVAVPTGAGKTTTIHALVWALAQQADRIGCERTVGVRTIWAVDRRILVDDVHRLTEELASALHQAVTNEDSPLNETACRLLAIAANRRWDGKLKAQDREAALARGLSPLAAGRWRGGLGERSQFSEPFQPEVISSTVAQVGSRLLFRGYGVSAKSQALAAGLAGTDVNICLDEVHIAEPFRQTLAQICAIRSKERERTAAPPLNVIAVSATQSAESASRIELGDDDKSMLGDRYTAEKRARLIDGVKNMDSELLKQVMDLVEKGHREVACVVNNVHAAAKIRADLEKRCSKVFGDGSFDVVLIMGPQTGLARRDAVHMLRSRLGSNPNGDVDRKPMIVVATQAIEVGVDISVSGLVTQSASAAAVTQRLGRLCRFGAHDIPGEAVILRDENNWLYRDVEPACWEWLRDSRGQDGTVDVSVRALTERHRPPIELDEYAPLLDDAVMRQLVQTNPKPAVMAEPAIEPYLQGVHTEPDFDVQVVWRSDLMLDEPGTFTYRKDLLTAVPPDRDETISLSIGSAKRFISRLLEGEQDVSLLKAEADVDGASDAGSIRDVAVDRTRAQLSVLRGDEVADVRFGSSANHDLTTQPFWIGRNQIRPGDVLVLPVSSGGADEYGLAPSVTDDDVPDIALAAALARLTQANRQPTARRLAFRFSAVMAHRRMQFASGAGETVYRRIAELLHTNAVGSDERSRDRLVSGFSVELDPPVVRAVLSEAIGTSDDFERESLTCADEYRWSARWVPFSEGDFEPRDGQNALGPDDGAWVIEGLPDRRKGRSSVGNGSRGERSSGRVSLADHSQAVSNRVMEYAVAAGLDDRERRTIEIAGLFHDLGKADPRFQAMLRGGAADPSAELLAKSGDGTEERPRSRTSGGRAGIPAGWRHEGSSVAVLRSAIDAGRLPEDEFDHALAIHCVGTHHGQARPIPMPPRDDGVAAEAFAVTVSDYSGEATGEFADFWKNGEWLCNFVTSVDRFGYWTLAYLESLLILADRTTSGEGR